jgi:glycosyltransferase involved in cell wall biosynthesis
LLVVAAPFISQGGVYTSLRRTLPLVDEKGVDVGVLWSSRVPGGELPGKWVRRVSEPRLRAFNGPALTRHVHQAAQEWKPDVMLSVLPQSDVACAKVSSRLGIHWIAMIRGRPFPTGDEASALKKSIWVASVRRAYRKASLRLAVSQGLVEEVRDGLGIEIEEVMHNGVDVANYPFRARIDQPAKIGFIGRLTKDKAPKLVCDVARILDRPVDIIGDGPLRAELESMAAADARVRVHGWLNSNDAMQMIDVLVVPSLREGLPNVVLEAGASGVTVVARHIGGIPEMLERDDVVRERCLLPEDADAATFAAAIEPIADDPSLRLDLSQRLCEVVSRDFSIEHAASNLATAIKRVAGTGAE